MCRIMGIEHESLLSHGLLYSIGLDVSHKIN